ncbi:MAG: hypothetical protein NE328_24905 [Lentisphaeraceae bacterium]|nr:hypothetical protein [Lentisphaeraceae bacterium]
MTINQIISFLEKVEDPDEQEMNTRSLLSDETVNKILERFPSIPKDYQEYIKHLGTGACRECACCVYEEPQTPDELMGEGGFSLGRFDKDKYLAFGDGFSGDLFAFNTDDWSIVILSHVDDFVSVYPNISFSQFISKQIGLGENGEDLWEEE